MFAEEREWPVLCRYSSESANPGLDVDGLITRDRMSDLDFSDH